MSGQDRVRIRCPHCQKTLSVPATLHGKTISCPNPDCKKPFAVHGATVPSQRPSPPADKGMQTQPRERPTMPHAPPARRPWLVIGGVGCGAFVVFLSSVVIGVLSFGP